MNKKIILLMLIFSIIASSVYGYSVDTSSPILQEEIGQSLYCGINKVVCGVKTTNNQRVGGFYCCPVQGFKVNDGFATGKRDIFYDFSTNQELYPCNSNEVICGMGTSPNDGDAFMISCCVNDIIKDTPCRSFSTLGTTSGTSQYSNSNEVPHSAKFDTSTKDIYNLVFCPIKQPVTVTTTTDPNLLMQLHMDETSGAIMDSSGNGRNLVPNGGVTYGNLGRINQALGFNGINSYLSGSMPFPNSVSVSFWIKPISIPSTLGYFFKLGHGPTVYMFNTGSAGFGTYIKNGAGSTSWKQISLGNLPFNQASHIVVEFDGSQLISYVNGVKIETLAVSGTLDYYDNEIIIGQWHIGQNKYFEGLMDEFHIWGRALTDAEVNSLYNTGSISTGSVSPPITASPTKLQCIKNCWTDYKSCLTTNSCTTGGLLTTSTRSCRNSCRSSAFTCISACI